MKNNLLAYPLLFLFAFLLQEGLHAANTPGKTTLSGKITDKANGQPITGATLYIPELRSGAVTALDGDQGTCAGEIYRI
jgi:hypothetical protein